DRLAGKLLRPALDPADRPGPEPHQDSVRGASRREPRAAADALSGGADDMVRRGRQAEVPPMRPCGFPPDEAGESRDFPKERRPLSQPRINRRLVGTNSFLLRLPHVLVSPDRRM